MNLVGHLFFKNYLHDWPPSELFVGHPISTGGRTSSGSKTLSSVALMVRSPPHRTAPWGGSTHSISKTSGSPISPSKSHWISPKCSFTARRAASSSDVACTSICPLQEVGAHKYTVYVTKTRS